MTDATRSESVHPQDARVTRATPFGIGGRADLLVAAGAVLVTGAMLGWRGAGGVGGSETGSALEWLRYLTWAGMVAVFVFAAPRAGLREAYLVALSVAVTIAALLFSPDPAAAIRAGLDQGAFLMAFILLLTLLFETALTSPAVAACGEHMALQPSGRRHTALFWGTDVMAVLFNLGIVSLLTPLVRRGLPSDEEPAVRADMERRQVSAILRGFAWGVTWSPTALAPLALFELIDGIDRQRWTLLGLGITALVFALSFAEDLLRGRAHPELEPHTAPPPTPWKAYGRFALAVVALFALTALIVVVLDEGIVLGLMTACPLMMLGWLALQRQSLAAGARDAARLVVERLPTVGPVALTLAASGYLGRVGAALIPADAVEGFVAAIGLPQWGWLTVLPIVMVLLSYLAVSPIMLAVFFGSLFGALPALPTDATWLALSISCGWSVTMTASPFATVALLLAKQNEVSGARLTLGWNGPFTLASLALVAAFFYWLTGGA